MTFVDDWALLFRLLTGHNGLNAHVFINLKIGQSETCPSDTASQTPNLVVRHHHHHLSPSRDGRWGTTDDFAISVLHFSLFSTALWDLANSRPAHSLMLSSHLFLCLPCLLPHFTVLARFVLPDVINLRHDMPMQFAFLYGGQEVFVRSDCLLGLAHTFSLVTHAYIRVQRSQATKLPPTCLSSALFHPENNVQEERGEKRQTHIKHTSYTL